MNRDDALLAVLTAAEKATRPKSPLTVSEWADKHRLLTSEGSAEAGVAHQSRAVSARNHGCAERGFTGAQSGVHEIVAGRRHRSRQQLDRLHHGARQGAGCHRDADREGAQRLDVAEVRPDGRQHASGARCAGHAQQPRRGQQRQPQAVCGRYFLRQNCRLDGRAEIHLAALRDCRRGGRIRLDHAAGQPAGVAEVFNASTALFVVVAHRQPTLWWHRRAPDLATSGDLCCHARIAAQTVGQYALACGKSTASRAWVQLPRMRAKSTNTRSPPCSPPETGKRIATT